MEELKIKKVVLGIMSTNFYLIENGQHSIVIDPWDQEDLIIDYLVQNNLKLKVILLTHAHFDHIGAIDKLVEKYNCEVYVHQNDYAMIYDDNLNLSNHFNSLKIKSNVNAINDFIDVDHFRFEFVNLPGHTAGSCFIFLKKYHVIFSGDVLFKNSIGRFDFPTSSSFDTKKSMLEIQKIDDDYKIYPGHGESTTLLQEKLNNPYLQVE